MEIRNCRACGRMFSYIEGGSFLCPACQAELEDKFQVAKKYIRENAGASIQEVAEAADVSVKQIEKWIREERLAFADDSPVGIASNFSDLYEKPKKVEPPVKKEAKENKMRFL